MRKLLIVSLILIFALSAAAEPLFVNDSYFSYDKVDHLFTGLIITVSSLVLADHFSDRGNPAVLAGALMVPVLFSVGKEVYDGVTGTGHVSYKDLIYDFLGIIIGIIIVR
ncbi:MAG: hypothetical protein R6U31_00940 [bacterium]